MYEANSAEILLSSSEGNQVLTYISQKKKSYRIAIAVTGFWIRK
jgi:hypothetical protein